MGQGATEAESLANNLELIARPIELAEDARG